MAVGTIHFSGYREVGGVVFPTRQIVTIGRAGQAPRDLDGAYFHRILVESAAFDTVDPSILTPDASLPTPADDKPASVDAIYGDSR